MAKKARFEDDPELNEELDQELEDTLEDEDDETSDDEEEDDDEDFDDEEDEDDEDFDDEEDEDDEDSDDEEDEDDEDSDDEEDEDDEDFDDEEDEDDEDSDDEEDEDDEDSDDEEDEDDEDSDDEEDEDSDDEEDKADFDVAALFGEEDADNNPQWDDGENWDEFTSTDWAKKLAKHPQSAFVCEWEELQGHDWAILLSKQPQLSKRCRCWENLDNEDWVELLQGQPQFASRCDWKLFKGAESQQMALIGVMKAHPKIVEACDFGQIGLSVDGWLELLKSFPHLAKRCEWKLFNRSESNRKALIGVMKAHSEIVSACSFGQINFSAADWLELLTFYPQVASRCDWKLFKGFKSQQMALIELMKAYPEIVEACDFGQIDLSVDGWLELLKFFPHLAKQCRWYLFKTEEVCATLIEWLKVLPALAKGIESAGDHFRDINFTASAWLETMALYPTLAKFCDWSLFRDEETHPALIKLMKKHSAIAEVCDYAKVDFTSDEWLKLLAHNPNLAPKCNWSVFEDGEHDEDDQLTLIALMEKYPVILEACKFEKIDFTAEGWLRLLDFAPQLAHVLNVGPSAAIFESETSRFVELIKKHPTIAKECDIDDARLGDKAWEELLKVHPKLGKYRNWDEQLDFENETRFVEVDNKGELDPFVHPGKWAELVVLHPLFAEWCDWESLDGFDWSYVLAYRPQFADRCDWEKLNARNWMILLALRPEFEDHCDKEMLRTRDWGSGAPGTLLAVYPQLKKYLE